MCKWVLVLPIKLLIQIYKMQDSARTQDFAGAYSYRAVAETKAQAGPSQAERPQSNVNLGLSGAQAKVLLTNSWTTYECLIMCDVIKSAPKMVQWRTVENGANKQLATPNKYKG